MTVLSWLSIDARTGAVIADLPRLAFQWPMRRSLGRVETATAVLPLPSAPPRWDWATREGGAVLIALEDNVPIWGGLVLDADDSSGPAVTLSLVTIEHYLDRRYVGDVVYTQRGQNAIVSDLIGRFVVDGAGPGRPGIPLTVRYTGGDGVGTLRDRTYKDTDDATVLTRLQQLSAVAGGPEWVIEWEWAPDRQHIVPVLYVGARVGSATPAGLRPQAWFTLPGSVTEAHLIRSYAPGKGANDFTAVSSGQDDTRPSARYVLPDFEQRPTFEHRWTPSTSITNVDTLASYARQAASVAGRGSRVLTLTAALGKAPRLGAEWRLGDDLFHDLSGPAWPAGLSGVARAIAWERTKNTVTPILAVPEIPTEEAA